MKRDALDSIFSDYIRLRDGKCLVCGKQPTERADGFPVKGLEVSHYHGRRKRSVRWDVENCAAHCHTCHRYFTENPHMHHEWKLYQLGADKYDALVLRANRTRKFTKSEKAELVAKYKELIKGMVND